MGHRSESWTSGVARSLKNRGSALKPGGGESASKDNILPAPKQSERAVVVDPGSVVHHFDPAASSAQTQARSAPLDRRGSARPGLWCGAARGTDRAGRRGSCRLPSLWSPSFGCDLVDGCRQWHGIGGDQFTDYRPFTLIRDLLLRQVRTAQPPVRIQSSGELLRAGCQDAQERCAAAT